MNDTTRTAFMLVVTNLLAVAVLFGISLSAEQVAGLTSLVNSTTILFMFLFKNGQQASGTSSALSATVTSTPVTPPASTPAP